jgi:hypothetical protein
VANIEEGRGRFQKLKDEFKNEPVLRCQAMLGIAEAEEALIGIPKENSPGEYRGNIDEAIKRYREVADTYPTTELGRKAGERGQELFDKRDVVEKFYRELWAKLAEAGSQPEPKTPPISPFPPLTPEKGDAKEPAKDEKGSPPSATKDGPKEMPKDAKDKAPEKAPSPKDAGKDKAPDAAPVPKEAAKEKDKAAPATPPAK